MHPDHRSIGELAYRLWQSRGCPDGTAERDWLEAEKQLTGDEIPSPYEAVATIAALILPRIELPLACHRYRKGAKRVQDFH